MNKKDIKISIIVPVYNVAKYIKKCILSILRQTLDDIEIIIINDGSTDESAEIIKSLMKVSNRKITFLSQDNCGVGSARNLGLKYANGEFISFVDGDDYIDPNFAKTMYQAAKSIQAQVAVCDMVDVYDNGYTLYHDVTNFKYIYETTPSVCNKIFKSELFKDVKFITDYWYEDLNIMCKICTKISKIARVHSGYYYCHCREISIMNNNNSEKNKDIIVVLEEAKKYLENNNTFNKNIFEYLVYDHVLITTINRVALHKNIRRDVVLRELVKYCRSQLPDYKKNEFYKRIPIKRKIIAWLNYNNLYCISRFLLKIRKVLDFSANYLL